MSIVQYHNTPLVELHEDFLTAAECQRLLSLPLEFNRSQGWNRDTDSPHLHDSRTSESAYAGKITPKLKKKIADYFDLTIDEFINQLK